MENLNDKYLIPHCIHWYYIVLHCVTLCYYLINLMWSWWYVSFYAFSILCAVLCFVSSSRMAWKLSSCSCRAWPSTSDGVNSTYVSSAASRHLWTIRCVIHYHGYGCWCCMYVYVWVYTTTSGLAASSFSFFLFSSSFYLFESDNLFDQCCLLCSCCPMKDGRAHVLAHPTGIQVIAQSLRTLNIRTKSLGS